MNNYFFENFQQRPLIQEPVFGDVVTGEEIDVLNGNGDKIGTKQVVTKYYGERNNDGQNWESETTTYYNLSGQIDSILLDQNNQPRPALIKKVNVQSIPNFIKKKEWYTNGNNIRNNGPAIMGYSIYNNENTGIKHSYLGYQIWKQLNSSGEEIISRPPTEQNNGGPASIQYFKDNDSNFKLRWFNKEGVIIKTIDKPESFFSEDLANGYSTHGILDTSKVGRIVENENGQYEFIEYVEPTKSSPTKSQNKDSDTMKNLFIKNNKVANIGILVAISLLVVALFIFIFYFTKNKNKNKNKNKKNK